MLEQKLRNRPKILDLGSITALPSQPSYQQSTNQHPQPYTFNYQPSPIQKRSYDLSQVIRLRDCNPK